MEGSLAELSKASRYDAYPETSFFGQNPRAAGACTGPIAALDDDDAGTEL